MIGTLPPRIADGVSDRDPSWLKVGDFKETGIPVHYATHLNHKRSRHFERRAIHKRPRMVFQEVCDVDYGLSLIHDAASSDRRNVAILIEGPDDAVHEF